MHTQYRFSLRILLAATLLVLGVAILAVTDPTAFSSQVVIAASVAGVERVAPATQYSTSLYRWNLNDEGVPLINLPDRIGGGLDQSLTYRMDQFEFPLFQSLYYNERAHKYVLVVVQKDDVAGKRGNAGELAGRRAEFVELVRSKDGKNFAANGKLNLRLEEKGGLKVLTTSDETVYTFALLGDGELHCRQISDRRGEVINLDYTDEALLRSINDDRGRTLTFNYTNDYVSSVAQSWFANAKRLRKTWTVADEVRFAHAPASIAAAPISAAPLAAKHIPSNATRAIYSRAMAASDSVLAAIFGGPGAVAAANGFEPSGLGRQYPLYRGDQIADDGRVLRGHLSFAMHLYGSVDGTGDTDLYIPTGFTTHSNEPSPTDAVMTFYYPRLGKLTDVTLAVFHVRNFQLNYEGDRVHIGSIGGPGGSIGSYRHSHLEFYRGNTGLPCLAARQQLRIDPATVFGQ
ncbi:MAG TPA: hypothetical protein VGO56_16570 [Pyrinomonadaceae bacterium]|jgi:hypothetical protein|nr:hypothetical protein [Pyrinomonadaceae bacterium]